MKDWYKLALTSVNILIPIVVLAWGTQADIDRVVNGDGGRHVGAVLFGWLPSVLLVLVCWAGIRGFRALRATNRLSRAS
jgi:hypothetical protein